MAIRQLQTVQARIEKLYEGCRKLGAMAVVYRAAEPFHAPSSSGMLRITHGFSRQWQDANEKFHGYRESPFPDMALRSGKPVHFRAADLSQCTEQQIEYLQSVVDHIDGDGVGFPLYGPAGNDGYCAILFDHHLTADEVGVCMGWLGDLQALHVEIVLQSQQESLKTFALSKRELEVLKCVACGFGNKKISEKMNISLSTVDTHLRRIFSKLETNDRTEASVKAISLGILRL